VVAVVYKSLSLDQLRRAAALSPTTAGLSDSVATPSRCSARTAWPRQRRQRGLSHCQRKLGRRYRFSAGRGQWLHPVVVSLGGLAVLVVLTAVLLAAAAAPAPPA
jgi:hypothetical protein